VTPAGAGVVVSTGSVTLTGSGIAVGLLTWQSTRAATSTSPTAPPQQEPSLGAVTVPLLRRPTSQRTTP